MQKHDDLQPPTQIEIDRILRGVTVIPTLTNLLVLAFKGLPHQLIDSCEDTENE